MLRHVGHLKALPKSFRTKRPIFWVCSYQQEHCESQKDNRPILRPGESSCAQGQYADSQHDNSGPVMVVFGPGDIARLRRTVRRLARYKRIQVRRCGRTKWARRRELIPRWSLKAGPLWFSALGDLRRRHLVTAHING